MHSLSGDLDSVLTLTPFVPVEPDDPKFVGAYNSIGACLALWQEELCGDPDRSYLLQGIEHGFRISYVDRELQKSTRIANHRSAEVHRPAVEKELRAQIKARNCVIAGTETSIISPIAAIRKHDGGVIRLTHDGSHPVGEAMNDYLSLHSVKCESISNAQELAKQNYYMAKVDLKSAYRSVPIHPDDYSATGLCWQFEGQPNFTYLFDSRVPFGSRCGPSIFHRLSQVVKHMMARRGYKCLVVYLDDLLIVCETKQQCNEALHVLIKLLCRRGFGISWAKVVGPTQRIVFLGILIDIHNAPSALMRTN